MDTRDEENDNLVTKDSSGTNLDSGAGTRRRDQREYARQRARDSYRAMQMYHAIPTEE